MGRRQSHALGSTVALAGASGGVTASFSYEPYGKSEKSGSADTSVRFTGREDDGATKLQYFRARYYLSSVGRFISEDPIGLQGGLNEYAYANGDPLSYTDPLGLAASDASCENIFSSDWGRKACKMCLKVFCQAYPAGPACCGIARDECNGNSGGDPGQMQVCNAEFLACMFKNRKGGQKPPSPPPDI